jgi:DNA-binding CsgD family transcriptional regulator
MAYLTNSEVRSLLKFLQELLKPCTLEDLPDRVLSQLPQVVSSELTVWTSARFQHHKIVNVETSGGADISKYFQVANQHFDEHPFVHYYFRTGNGKAHSISDFISEGQLHRLEGLYQNFLHPIGMEDQMVVVLPKLLGSNKGCKVFYEQEEDIVISLHRSQRGFSQRDRLLLNLLRPHLAQAFQTAKAYTQLQQSLAQFNQSLEQLGIIIITTDGKILLMTERARRLLTRYFRPTLRCNHCLPETLQRWLTHQIQLLSQEEDCLLPCQPLRIDQEKQRLMIRLIPDPTQGQYLLFLEEEKCRSLSATELELVGLTKREAEVLFWVTQDKSDMEIATVLGTTRGTVKKHLEHIYQKFNVHTRTAAVMHALKDLGFFGGLLLLL